jgi:hypothetical protein
LAPEPIIKQDGESKNDSERNASKRFLEKMRKTHPHLRLIVIEDGLSSIICPLFVVRSRAYFIKKVIKKFPFPSKFVRVFFINFHLFQMLTLNAYSNLIVVVQD